MEKEKIEETVSKVADGVILALHAEGARDFVDVNQKKKQNKRIRNDMTSTSRDKEKYWCLKVAAKQRKKTREKQKRSLKNDPPTETPSCNFIQERNACAVTAHDTESGSNSSSSFDEALVSWVRRQKSRNLKKRDNSVERNKENDKSEGTEILICSAPPKDLLLQLPVNSCLKEDSEVKCKAPDVCLSVDTNDAEKQCEKHVLVECIPNCQDHETSCNTPCLNAEGSTENDSKTEPPFNSFMPERNASAVTTNDVTSVKCASSSFEEVLSSPVGRQNSWKPEKRGNSLERDKETEKSESTKSPTCSLSEKVLLLQLPVNSCLKEYSEVNCNALGVCLSRDKTEAEKQCEKHNVTERLEICRDLEATCSTPCSNAGNICSAAESNGSPVSGINSIPSSLAETHDDRAVVANSKESDILVTCERGISIKTYNRQRKIVVDPPAVNSESILDTRSLLLVPNRKQNPSLVQSVEAPSFCSKHVNQKEFDEGDVRIPSLPELCASRDEIVHNNSVVLLTGEGSLAGNSQKKLLVLDINGLLADVVYHVLEGYTPDAVISGRSVFKRPFCDEFLEFCFERFNVGVWSSRMRRNVELILDFLMGNLKHKLLFCWDQSHCTDSYHTTVENRKKPLLVKKLKKLWKKYEPGLPWELGAYNESNTLLLDDSPYKAVCNPPYTAVFPTTYQYTDKEDNSLGPGGELRMYLEGLAMAENVQKYVEENPIGKRPITEKNPSWRFYLEVIRACSSPENSPTRPTFHWQGYRY